MRKTFEKIITTLLIATICINFICPNLVFAASWEELIGDSTLKKQVEDEIKLELDLRFSEGGIESVRNAATNPEYMLDISTQLKIRDESGITNYNNLEDDIIIPYLREINIKAFLENYIEEHDINIEPEDVFPEEGPAYYTNLEGAKSELLSLIAEKRVEYEATLPEEISDEARQTQLQHYFEGIKTDFQNGTGDFYNEVISISNTIIKDSDRRGFINSVPSYITQYIEDQLNGTSLKDRVINFFSIAVDGASGVLLWGFRMLLIIPGAVIEFLTTLFATTGSETNTDWWLTIDNIFFNEVPALDINIFDFGHAANSTISNGNVLLTIRQSVSGWYYALRNLSIALALAVLVYIGIRMAISSVAEDRAKYKKMLKDWFVSFALIFVLHYFMVFLIQLNSGIVNMLANSREAQALSITGASSTMIGGEAFAKESMQVRLLDVAVRSAMLTTGFGAAITYLMLSAMTLLFIIVYVKRFITIAFLAMICPLITVTYAIDKAGDGKAQAFGKWMMEFTFNVLIQPFHCIIYLVFIQNMFEIIISEPGIINFGRVIVAVVMLGFMYKSEDIIKAIFGFETSSLSSAALIGAAAISRAQSAAKGAKGFKNANELRKGISNIKNPSTLPSKAGTGTPAPSGGGSSGGSSGSSGGRSAKPGLGKRVAGGLLKVNTGKTARRLAGKVIGAAAAYGMTGDAKQTYAASKMIGNAKKRLDNARLNNSVSNRKELTRDAYQDYAEHKGLTDKNQRLAEAQRLLNADINTLSGDERNMAEWLHAEEEMYKMMGVKDTNKAVMDNLRDYEGV